MAGDDFDEEFPTSIPRRPKIAQLDGKNVDNSSMVQAKVGTESSDESFGDGSSDACAYPDRSVLNHLNTRVSFIHMRFTMKSTRKCPPHGKSRKERTNNARTYGTRTRP